MKRTMRVPHFGRSITRRHPAVQQGCERPGTQRTLRPGILAGLIAGLLLAGCAGGAEQPEFKPVPFPPPPDETRYFYERTLSGTADVQVLTDEDRWRQLLTGASSKSGVPFAKPFDIAVHQGRVFVSDTVRQVIVVLDFPQHKSFTIGDKGDAGDVGKPLGIAVDGAGKLYVVDNKLKRVSVYDRDGNYRFAFGGSDVLNRPSGIDVSPDGSRAYVVDVGGVDSDKHVIHVFDTSTQERLYTISSRGRDPGKLNLPRDVALGPDGLLYVSDGGNFRVQVFKTTGEFVRQWGQAGMRFGQFSRPKGIAVDLQGNVYVIDAAFGNFQIFNSEGQLLMFIGKRSEQNGPAVFMLPAGIDIDEDGRVYAVDQFFRKVDVFRPAALQPEQGFLAAQPTPQ